MTCNVFGGMLNLAQSLNAGFSRHRWREQVEAVLHGWRRSAAYWLLLWCICCYRRPVWYV